MTMIIDMNITTTINPDWGQYDTTVAECHLFNYGVIFLDEWGCPIDDEYTLEELYQQYKR